MYLVSHIHLKCTIFKNLSEIAVCNVRGCKVTFHKVLSSIEVIHSEQENKFYKKSQKTDIKYKL